MSVSAAPVLWLMGLSGAGKTTIGTEVAARIQKFFTHACCHIDEDILRTIATNCMFGCDWRMQNVRSGAALAKSISDQGITVIATFMTPYKEMHAMLHKELGDRLSLIYVKASVDACMQRDPKGLYAQHQNGELASPMVGMSNEPDAVFDIPADPELVLDTELYSKDQCSKKLLAHWCTRAK